MGLLQCSHCGGTLKILGKTGAYLKTECIKCGASSEPMMRTYLANMEQRSDDPYFTAGKIPPQAEPKYSR